MVDNADNLARRLKALAVPARVRIVQLLKGRALYVNALAARLDLTQGAVSQHLRVLRDAALLIAEKRGCFVHYRLADRTLAAWRSAVDRLLDPAATGRKGNHPCPAPKKPAKVVPGRRPSKASPRTARPRRSANATAPPRPRRTPA